MVSLILGILIGAVLGRLLARHLSERHVRYGFATILVLVAGGLLVRSIG